jgi:hypothetical protein
MKLFFRPDPFIDKNGQEIELEDIEIEEWEVSQDETNFADFTIFRGDNYFRYLSTYRLDCASPQDFQEELENLWNDIVLGINTEDEEFRKFLLSKRKNSLGRLDENSGVKLQLDLEGLKDMNKGLKAALEIIEEDDMNTPSSPITYEDIIKAIEKQKQDVERLSGDKE